MLAVIEVVLIVISSISLITTIGLFIVYKLKKTIEPKINYPKVTVFVPFYNECPSLLITALEHLERQDYPKRLQVVLIDDGSTNGVVNDVKEWLSISRIQQYELIEKKINGGRKGFALDYALELGIATGDVYVVVDSDTFIESEGIKELSIKLWSDDRYAAVCGYITPSNYQESFIGLLQHYEHSSFYGAIRSAQDKIGLVPVQAGAFVAHRASAVHDLGGWSEWLVEDIAWCWKALSRGYRSGYASKAKAKTHCPVDSKGLFKQRRRWARGRVEAYLETWKTSKFAGVCATPWFMSTVLHYVFPSSLLVIAFMVAFGIWIPLALGVINLVLYLMLNANYLRDNKGLYEGMSKSKLLKAPLFAMLLETIIWLPNLLGCLDELFGRKKTWLTR
ncbi:glycosyltransferase family 2 protein [Vibrio parahaemolyticus]